MSTFIEYKESGQVGIYTNEPLTNLSVRKSNDFISAKYKSSLLENQVMAIALTRIEVNNTEKDSPLEAKLYPGELKKLVSDPAHIYRDLKKLAKTITGHTMFLEDGKGNFKAFSVVPNADYIDGVFIIKFNNALKDHVLGLEKNYTNLELSIMTDLKKNSSFRLYEVLKKEVYKIPKGKDSFVQVEYNISELRFIIGLANSDDATVKNAMAQMGRNVDWDELYDRLDKRDKKYEEWRDFQRRVLKPAQEELLDKSDVRFEYEGIREGRRMKRVLFTIYNNVPKHPDLIDERKKFIDANSGIFLAEDDAILFFSQLVEEFEGHNGLTRDEIQLLLQRADGNADKVRKAIELADKQAEIKNYMGWLIRCIENNYVNIETLSGSAEQANVISKVEKEYVENKSNVIMKVWERTKTKDDFGDFVHMVEENGLSQEVLESIYPIEEILQMYADWKVGRVVNF